MSRFLPDCPTSGEGREILRVHSKNRKLGKDVALSVIAKRTPGFSGADLANLMNEAAILAGRRGRDRIASKEIDDLIVAGMEGTKMIDGKNRILAVHHGRCSWVWFASKNHPNHVVGSI